MQRRRGWRTMVEFGQVNSGVFLVDVILVLAVVDVDVDVEVSAGTSPPPPPPSPVPDRPSGESHPPVRGRTRIAPIRIEEGAKFDRAVGHGSRDDAGPDPLRQGWA